MIHHRDISVVVQGPILTDSIHNMTDTVTKDVCARIKKLMPECELILSTWEGSKVKGITHDKCVFSKDPGGTTFCYIDKKILNNCNRLIVSTQAGIKAASRPYVLKVRSDLFLASTGFLKYFDKFPHYDNKYKFVKDRIMAFCMFTIKAHKTSLFTVQKPYHIGDWAYFGNRQDLWNLYDIPLTKEPEFSHWFLKNCRYFYDIHPHRLWKMPPEQYVTTEFLKKYTKIKFNHMADTDDNNVEKSDKLLTNNFLVLDQTQFSLISLKYMSFQLLFDSLLSSTAIFFHTWLQDYYKHCDVPQSATTHKDQVYIKLRQGFYYVANKILLAMNYRFGLIDRLIAKIIKSKL